MYFNAIYTLVMGISKIYVILSFLDILMGHLHWMHPEDCNDHWGGEPISPIRLKPFKLVITYINPTIFYRKWFKT